MKRLCIALIRFYQRNISPLKRHPTCRFRPTCSAYALEAYTKRGFFAGTVLSVWRLLRCQPLCRGGYDPVPEKGFRRKTEWTGYSLAEFDTEDPDVPADTGASQETREENPDTGKVRK